LVSRQAALVVTGRWLADLRDHVHVTDRDWADAQALLGRYAAKGLGVVEVPEFSALGPGVPAGLSIVKETGS
jgi:hypothetical protein